MTTTPQNSIAMNYSVLEKRIKLIIDHALKESKKRGVSLISAVFDIMLWDKSEQPAKTPEWLKHLSAIISLFYYALSLIASRQLFAQHYHKTHQSIVLKPRLIKPQFSTAPPKF